MAREARLCYLTPLRRDVFKREPVSQQAPRMVGEILDASKETAAAMRLKTKNRNPQPETLNFQLPPLEPWT